MTKENSQQENPASQIAEELGDLKADSHLLQVEIARLNKKSIVPLEHIKDLHNWLDEKRKARQSCRLVGESRTGKTVACEAYTFRNKPKQEGKQALYLLFISCHPLNVDLRNCFGKSLSI